MKDLSWLSKVYSDWFREIDKAVRENNLGFKEDNLKWLFDIDSKVDHKALMIYLKTLLEKLPTCGLKSDEE